MTPRCRRTTVMAARNANIRRACAIPTDGMSADPQFSRSYLATAAAVKQLQRSLQEQYSMGVQARFGCLSLTT